MLKLNISISHTIDREHPYCGVRTDEEWEDVKDTIYTYNDAYTFYTLGDNEEDKQFALEFAMEDLKHIAGGGYNSKHIHNVKFNYRFL